MYKTIFEVIQVIGIVAVLLLAILGFIVVLLTIQDIINDKSLLNNLENDEEEDIYEKALDDIKKEIVLWKDITFSMSIKLNSLMSSVGDIENDIKIIKEDIKNFSTTTIEDEVETIDEDDKSEIDDRQLNLFFNKTDF